MNSSALRGKTALVTGASSGLGAAFARRLAAMGADLVITARRTSQLEALATELRANHGVAVETIGLDLAEPTGAASLFDQTEGAGRAIDVLINNAGFGNHQEFLEMPWDQVARQIQLNVVTLTELTWRIARAMRARGGGHVLNVASIGAYTPTPTYATYAAGKAYVRDFTEAIAWELRRTNVRVCCLCPGGTLTEFHQAAGHQLPPLFRATFMSAERCAAIGLRALYGGRHNVVSGWSNKLMMFLLRFLPRRIMIVSSALTMGRPRGAPSTGP